MSSRIGTQKSENFDDIHANLSNVSPFELPSTPTEARFEAKFSESKLNKITLMLYNTCQNFNSTGIGFQNHFTIIGQKCGYFVESYSIMLKIIKLMVKAIRKEH